MKLISFEPHEGLLHGPGPSNVHPRVLQAMTRQTIGYFDPEFVNFMEEVIQLLRSILETKNSGE
jgi:alanine-glyoxylate transaminase / serine-glyoxylate transaminase / serine-pyruvate transaminase